MIIRYVCYKVFWKLFLSWVELKAEQSFLYTPTVWEFNNFDKLIISTLFSSLLPPPQAPAPKLQKNLLIFRIFILFQRQQNESPIEISPRPETTVSPMQTKDAISNTPLFTDITLKLHIRRFPPPPFERGCKLFWASFSFSFSIYCGSWPITQWVFEKGKRRKLLCVTPFRENAGENQDNSSQKTKREK